MGWIGLAAGAAVGAAFALCGLEGIGAIPVLAAIGMGGGALAGGIYDHAQARRNVICGQKTLSLTPVLAPRASAQGSSRENALAYGFALGDINGDRFPDIALAPSGGTNVLSLSGK